MDCRISLALLDAYLDGELDRTEARALEAHLDSCPDCAAALASADDLRRALRDPALRHRAPQALHARVRATLDAQTRAAAAETTARTSIHAAPPVAAHAQAVDPRTQVIAFPPRPRRLPAWLGIAAACLLSFGGGALLMQQRSVDTTATDASAQWQRDLFASHWRALAATSPVDVVSSDHHTVKPWFAGKIAESPPVQDFAAQGFALVGGRIDYLGTQRVAVLVYRHGAHLIDVYALPQAAPPTHALSRGYAAESIQLGTQPAVMVTDMDAGERARLADLLAGIR
ncbi:MAG: anti-sigma factor [Proteobacteria bacterium]|nr:anti-sigma factor [Pseudomonadota bacterium]